MCEKEKSDNLFFIKEIFNNKRYKIPNYQRGYSWEKEHREDLLEDIENIHRLNYTHFTGTIVAARKKEVDKPIIYEIVDGQQRLTSIFLLLHQYFRKFPNNQVKISDEWKKSILNTRPDERILTLNSETDAFFSKLISIDNYSLEVENKSQQNLLNAKNEFDKWFMNTENIEIHINSVINKLGFLFYSPYHYKEIGIMFEVINNRGKPLSDLEKVKNYLTYYSNVGEFYELEKKVTDAWPKILSNLSDAELTENEDENAFLRYCWITFYSSNKTDSHRVYEVLKDNFHAENQTEDDQKTLLNFLQMLEISSKYYKEFYKEPDKVLESLRYQPQKASIFPLYLAIRHTANKLKQYELENELLSLLEILNFRTYVCPEVTKRADTHQGELFGWANRLYRTIFRSETLKEDNKLNLQETKNKIINFINYWCNTKHFIQSLTLDLDENYDYYKDWSGLKYFLANYEQDKNEYKNIILSQFFNESAKKPDDKFDKEHLWAVNNRKNENGRGKDIHEKHRLGNFALLEGGLNRQGQDYSIEKKLKDRYIFRPNNERNSDLNMIKELPQIVQEAKKYAKKLVPGGWYKNTYYYFYQKINDIREERMINFAIQRWGLPEEKNNRVKVDSFSAWQEGNNEVFKIISHNK